MKYENPICISEVIAKMKLQFPIRSGYKTVPWLPSAVLDSQALVISIKRIITCTTVPRLL